MAIASEALPRWDTSNIYTGLDAADYQAAFRQLEQQTAELEAHFDQHNIRGGSPAQGGERVVAVGA
jgi:hypothetical protein